MRRAQRAGIVFERHAPQTAEEAAQLYARMLAVERESWKGMAACGMTEQPARQLYAVLVRNLARQGLARIMFARHGETDIGFIFGGKAGNVYRGQQFSYRETWKRWGIGNLLQVEQVRWLCEEGGAPLRYGPAGRRPHALQGTLDGKNACPSSPGCCCAVRAVYL